MRTNATPRAATRRGSDSTKPVIRWSSAMLMTPSWRASSSGTSRQATVTSAPRATCSSTITEQSIW